MWEWTMKKAECFQIVVLEKTLESPLDSKKIKPANSEGNQPWILIGRTDAEAEVPILWPPDMKSRWKNLDAGKDWGQEKGMTEDEIIGWHHQLNGHEFEWTPWDSEGQGSLVCWSSMGSQRVRNNWATEQQQPEFYVFTKDNHPNLTPKCSLPWHCQVRVNLLMPLTQNFSSLYNLPILLHSLYLTLPSPHST